MDETTSKITACPQCLKTAPGDCSRAQCARRKSITAQVSAGSKEFLGASGTFRRPPTKQGNES